MSTKRTYVGLATKSCENCGEDVTRKHSAFKEHVFCSMGCYLGSDYHKARNNASNARRFAGRRVVRPCDQCGADIERALSQFAGTNTFCSKLCQRAFAVDRAHKQINSRGYVVVFVGVDYPGSVKGQVLEHRKVMQDFLGRPLLEVENIHHRNGDRQDNRLENLELWTKSQPPGQRVADKLAWAREIVALYGGADL